MIRLELAGAHTSLLSSLCAECPQGSTGCCKSPPHADWPDVARIVALGGRDWILAEIAAGNLIPIESGLRLRRERRRTSITEPRIASCVYHGPTGCTITQSKRPATCNYFLCDDAYAEGGEGRGDADALAARAANELLKEQYGHLNEQFDAMVRDAWPEGPPWDAAFLDALGAELSRRASLLDAELDRDLAPLPRSA